MTRDEATKIWGPVILNHPDFEVRGRVEDNTMRVYSFRKGSEGQTLIPNGFVLGHNALHHEPLNVAMQRPFHDRKVKAK